MGADTSPPSLPFAVANDNDNPILATVLRPLAHYYDDPKTIEVRVTRPGEVVTDRRGVGLEFHADARMTEAAIEKICHALASHHGQYYHPKKSPKLSTIIPFGRHRFEGLTGPSVATKISVAIRCKHPWKPTWEMVAPNPAIKAFLQEAVLAGKSILIAGGTNTGKTTFMNMLLDFLPLETRVITVEDTEELDVDRFRNGTPLLAEREESRAQKQSVKITYREHYDHVNRITPDRILFGEISTSNAVHALNLLNSGAVGFMCSLHADSPDQALCRKFEQLIALSGHSLPNIESYLRETIDVVVQIKRRDDGMRSITDIVLPKEDRVFYRGGFA